MINNLPSVAREEKIVAAIMSLANGQGVLLPGQLVLTAAQCVDGRPIAT